MIGNQPTHFLYDGQTVIEELRDRLVFAEYVSGYGLDTICQIAVRDPMNMRGNEFWYHKDLLKWTQLLTDDRGRASSQYRYLPFGTSLPSQLAGTYNPLRFMGRRFDEAIGEYDFRIRAYSPRLGRFIQRDIIRSSNMYTFVSNNPLVSTDPTGKGREAANKPEQRDIESVSSFPTFSLSSPFLEGRFFEYYQERIRQSYSLLHPWIGYELGYKEHNVFTELDVEYSRIQAEKEAQKPNPMWDNRWEANQMINRTDAFAWARWSSNVSLTATMIWAQGEILQGAFGLGRLLLGRVGTETITLYSGISSTAELQALNETGYVMSEAAYTNYYVTRSRILARIASFVAHRRNLRTWYGSLEQYAQAHGEFGTMLSKEFGPRTLISFTSDPAIAAYYAGQAGRVVSITVPSSEVIVQTLATSTEDEFLFLHMAKLW